MLYLSPHHGGGGLVSGTIAALARSEPEDRHEPGQEKRLDQHRDLRAVLRRMGEVLAGENRPPACISMGTTGWN